MIARVRIYRTGSRSGMIPFFRDRASKKNSHGVLGHLEMTVMEILWERGQCNVHDVIEKLDRPLAYTTVMTTLDRLFKKQLLNRAKPERAFVYSPRMSRQQWELKQIDDLVSGLLIGSQPASELLISSLVEAAGEQDTALLDDLERKIKLKRKELSLRRKA